MVIYQCEWSKETFPPFMFFYLLPLIVIWKTFSLCTLRTTSNSIVILASVAKLNLENSREERKCIEFLVFLLFFLIPHVPRFHCFPYWEFPLAIILGQVCWQQIFFQMRMFWFLLHYWRLFSLGIEFWVGSFVFFSRMGTMLYHFLIAPMIFEEKSAQILFSRL